MKNRIIDTLEEYGFKGYCDRLYDEGRYTAAVFEFPEKAVNAVGNEGSYMYKRYIILLHIDEDKEESEQKAELLHRGFDSLVCERGFLTAIYDSPRCMGTDERDIWEYTLSFLAVERR